MAVDYKPLNRTQEFTTPQKAALKKVFQQAELAAVGSSALISRKVVHLALSGHFPATEKKALQALFKEIRSAIDATDSSRSLDSVFGSWAMSSDRRKTVKTMAEAVVAMIV